jgi:hypothetical protein
LERIAGIAPSPVGELAVVLVGCGCGAVAIVEVGTAGEVDKEAGVVVVTGGRRLETGGMADATVGVVGR